VAVTVGGIAVRVLVTLGVAWVGVRVGVRLTVADGCLVSVGNCSVTPWVGMAVGTILVAAVVIGKHPWISNTKKMKIVASLGTWSVYHKKFAFALH
jgi:hypothetical protein